MCFRNQPDLNILEIGSWEGRSTCWLLNNILTHPSSQITCIDTFEGGGGTELEASDTKESIKARFDFIIALTESIAKVTKIVNKSRAALREIPFDSFDIIYIDGLSFSLRCTRRYPFKLGTSQDRRCDDF